MNSKNPSLNDECSNELTSDNDDSWADIFEIEKGGSINNKLLDGSIQSDLGSTSHDDNNYNPEYNKLDDKICDNLNDVNNIIKIKLTKLSDIKILYNEVCIISYLKKYIDKNNKIINNKIEDKLEWLFNTSLYLSKKIGLDKYNYKKNNDKNIIHRSSYLFCKHGYECEYNYNPRKHGCFAQHFVHNMVCVDLTELIDHLKVSQSTYNNIKEIKKTICTISYVIDHMYEELKNGHKNKLYRNIHVNNIKQKQRKRRRNNEYRYNDTQNYYNNTRSGYW